MDSMDSDLGTASSEAEGGRERCLFHQHRESDAFQRALVFNLQRFFSSFLKVRISSKSVLSFDVLLRRILKSLVFLHENSSLHLKYFSICLLHKYK